jgi:hypothetical protein
MWEYAETDEKRCPCVNSGCEFYDNDDPDGYNCNLFYLPDGESGENYMSGDE